jgi:uncharacterized protein YegP (UPF0339 family)
MTCQSYMNPCPCCGRSHMAKPKEHGPLHLEIYKSRSANPKQRYRWRCTSGNGEKIAQGSEGYVRIIDCADMATYVVPNYVTISYPPGYKPKATAHGLGAL